MHLDSNFKITKSFILPFDTTLYTHEFLCTAVNDKLILSARQNKSQYNKGLLGLSLARMDSSGTIEKTNTLYLPVSGQWKIKSNEQGRTAIAVNFLYGSSPVSIPGLIMIDTTLDTLHTKNIMPSDTAKYHYNGGGPIAIDIDKNSSVNILCIVTGYKYSAMVTNVDSSGKIGKITVLDYIDYYNYTRFYDYLISTTDSGCAIAGETQKYSTDNYSSYYLIKIPSMVTTGIEDKNLMSESNTISVYPNPANTSFNISTKKPMQGAIINIYNIQGQLVQQSSNMSGSLFTLQRNNIPSGMYFLKIQDSTGKYFTAKVFFE